MSRAPNPDRVQVWSCGGGRQSAGIAAMIVQGRLPKPDHAIMVAIEWEMRSTFKYVNKFIRPAMQNLGIPFTYISRKKYAKVNFWSGAEDNSIVLPVYTNRSGQRGKLPEYCSGEWKREVARRWCSEQPVWKEKGVDQWMGISWDEKRRRRGPKFKWIQPVYPLLDWLPIAATAQDCIRAVEKIGWDEPPRSRCDHCPNQSDKEWLELTPEEFAKVCDREDKIREKDPNAFFHKSLIPLRMVELKTDDDNDGLFGGCTSGMCG